MKRTVCIMLTIVMVFTLAVSAFASTTTVTKSATNKTSTSSDKKKADGKEIIVYVKAMLNSGSFETKDEIDAAIRKVVKRFDLKMKESEIKQVTEILHSLQELGVEPKDVADQLDDIYAKYKTKIDNGTFSFDDVGIEDLGLGKIAKKSAGSVIKKAASNVKKFFSGLFGK